MKKDNIEGYPGYYISKRGILYSRLSGTWKKRKLGLDNKGYYVVKLHNEQGKKHFRINRLVAMVYIPNPDSLPIVCHKDNVRTNNHYKNLYWGTHLENSLQMVRDGRSLKGRSCNKKLNPLIIRREWESNKGISLRALGRKYKVSHTTIKRYIYEF
ncbi:MAG: zinc-binding loop region of homing endonuclease [Bacteriophage sp.]|jgi:hypothetical protein|nr:MAG: zinc-binding loop region of homing endonuclease [Bacteriophage sp.]DAU91049.1 MAG TPA: homing endonuclease [Caudoviricetes sp.]